MTAAPPLAMSLPALPNSSNFVGVALVINRNRDGPRFVFHYPPRIVPVDERDKERDKERDNDGGVDELDVPLDRSAGTTDCTLPYDLSVSDLRFWDQDEHVITDSGTHIVPWEHVAGFPTKDLESILTPAKAYHKTLFQIFLDPLYFVSYPIHKPENGRWRRRRSEDKKKGKKKGKKGKKKKNQKNQRHNKHTDAFSKEDDQASPQDDEDGDVEANPTEGDTPVESDADDVGASQLGDDLPAGVYKSNDEAKDKESSMTMFNMVFILNPRKHEAKDLIDTMYTNIVRKVNKAYEYVQQRNGFVWKEAKKILLLKDKAREQKRSMSVLWEEILQISSLAASMQDLYDAISRNKIAALQLDTGEGIITHSVQIPIPFHIADLPPRDREEDSRGLWLTTANSFVEDSDVFEEPHFLDKNFALLLIEDDEKIISELSADLDETTLAMIEFVRHSKPTTSFHQVAQETLHILTLEQVRKFAQHFIFWRRAIAIPPLHARDVYVVNPNADMTRLPRASAVWARLFPFAPALPNLLAELSAGPKSYKRFCPSKSLRPNYLQMLAWLMRGGWVTQLCTFAYIVVWPEILYEVDYALELEEVSKAKRAQVAAVDDLEHGEPQTLSRSSQTNKIRRGSGRRSDVIVASSIEHLESSTSSLRTVTGAEAGRSTNDPGAMATGAAKQPSAAAQPSSPSPSTLTGKPASANDGQPSGSPSPLSRPHAQPTLAEQIAEKARLQRIADKLARELAEKATAHARKVVPRETDHPSINNAPHLAHLSPYIIPDAKKATGKESLYLSAIAKRLRERKKRAARTSTNKGKTIAPASSNMQQQNLGDSVRRPTRRRDVKMSDAYQYGDWDERVANTWPVFWKYFNGRFALERIALQEEMKRKDVWVLLMAMSEYLLCVRHW